MISSENLDVVSVLTDSGSHENIINKIAGKIKNIIVEKPFVLTTSGAKRVVKKCIENSTRIFVVHQNRLNKTVEKLFELKNQNFFGKIFLCSVNLYWSRSDEYYNSDRWRGKWISDGGAIANQGIHYIDIIHKLLGDPYSISADSSRALNKIETEDTALINFKYKDGCLVNFQLTTAIRPKNIEGSISVFSEKGFYMIGGEALNELKAVKLLNYKANIDENYVIEDVYGKGHQIFYDKNVSSPRTPEVIQSLSNVVDNAFKYAKNKIIINLKYVEKFIIVEIIDDGKGFSPEIFSLLGEPYVRRILDEEDKGLGLGLFISKNLLSKSSSKIEFLDNKPKGSFIRIYLNKKELNIK